jgi:hypothetical protein
MRKLIGAFACALVLVGVVGIAAVPAGADPASSEPIFECAWPNPNIKGHFLTVWGYNNPSSKPETFEIGEHNRLLPPPYDRGQPTTFQPGRHDNVLVVDWDGKDETKWKVGSTTVKADDAPVCKTNPVPITGSGISAIVALCVVAVLGIGVSWFLARRRSQHADPQTT